MDRQNRYPIQFHPSPQPYGLLHLDARLFRVGPVPLRVAHAIRGAESSLGRCCCPPGAQHTLEDISAYIWSWVSGCCGWKGWARWLWLERLSEDYCQWENGTLCSNQCRDVSLPRNWVLCNVSLLWTSIFRVIDSGFCSWGYPFLHESYLYHLHRLDHRHNFSPYFYLTYLTYPSLLSGSDDPSLNPWIKVLRSPLTSFVPQMGLALGTGLLFGRKKEDLVFTWFVQTFVFVVFNKVCTSQVSPHQSCSIPVALD